MRLSCVNPKLQSPSRGKRVCGEQYRKNVNYVRAALERTLHSSVILPSSVFLALLLAAAIPGPGENPSVASSSMQGTTIQSVTSPSISGSP